MILDYITCPHCGYRSEDEEFCAACGKLFHEDANSVRNISVLGAVWCSFRSAVGRFEFDHQVSEVDASDDPGLPHLPGNSYHHIWKHKHQ